jgi:hypothetical protein
MHGRDWDSQSLLQTRFFLLYLAGQIVVCQNWVNLQNLENRWAKGTVERTMSISFKHNVQIFEIKRKKRILIIYFWTIWHKFHFYKY